MRQNLSLPAMSSQEQQIRKQTASRKIRNMKNESQPNLAAHVGLKKTTAYIPSSYTSTSIKQDSTRIRQSLPMAYEGVLPPAYESSTKSLNHNPHHQQE